MSKWELEFTQERKRDNLGSRSGLQEKMGFPEMQQGL